MKNIRLCLLALPLLAQQQVTITISSQTDPAKTVTLTGTIQPPITLSASPQTFTVQPGGQQTITIVTNDPKGVTCTASAGTLSLDCKTYTAPGTAPLSLSPASISLGPSGVQSFSISPSQEAVYTLSPNLGTVAKPTCFGCTGATYTAPATITAATVVTLTATTPAGSATATIKLVPSGSAGLSPTEDDLRKSPVYRTWHLSRWGETGCPAKILDSRFGACVSP